MKSRMTFQVLFGLLSALFFLVPATHCFAQNAGAAINTTGSAPDPSALLDVNSTQAPFQGTLITRLSTTNRNSIALPAAGLMIYNTDCNEIQYYNGTAWISMSLLMPLVATPGSSPNQTQFTANWNATPGATGFYLDVATDAGFSNFVSGYNNLDVGNVFFYNLSGLNCGTTYYFRLRPYNACGTGNNSNTIAYSTTACYTCGTDITDARDSKVYNTVLIGTQCWMKQNMNYGTRITGSSAQTNNGTAEKYCYSDLESSCTTYGGLYQWAEAVQYYNGATNTVSWSPSPSGNVQGVCPVGWHVPTDGEFSTLETFLGGTSVSGGHLKEAGTSHWQTPNSGADNSSGFTAIAAGGSNPAGTYFNSPYNAYFWTSTEYSPVDAWFRDLAYNNGTSYRGAYTKNGQGISIRCLLD